MDPHRRAEQRSLAYHRIIAERMMADPSVLERARRRVRAWLDERHGAPAEAEVWAGVLAREPAEIARVLVEDTEDGRALRQSTPFAGALTPRERWRVWRELRDSP
jgi:hypothetical protein